MATYALVLPKTNDPSARTISPLVSVLTGNQAHKAPVSLTTWNNASVPSQKVRNENASGESFVAYAANFSTKILAANNGGVTMAGTLAVTGAATFASTVTIEGVLTANANVVLGNAIGDTVTIAGPTTIGGTLAVAGNVTLGDAAGDTVTISGPATIGGTLGVTGLTTLTTLTTTGNVILGDAVGDTVVIAGPVTLQNTLTVKNGSGGATALLVDPVTPLVTVTAPVSVTGDVILVGNTRRYQADWSNATLANRAMIQSSIVNGFTFVGALPNGTSQIAGFAAYDNSTPGSSSTFQFYTLGSSNVHVIDSANDGGGVNPISIRVGGSEIIGLTAAGIGVTGDVEISGNFGCNGATPPSPPTLSAAATNLATVITLANEIRDLLQDNGQAN